jgi:hypothetical protein
MARRADSKMFGAIKFAAKAQINAKWGRLAKTRVERMCATLKQLTVNSEKLSGSNRLPESLELFRHSQ